MKEKTVGDISNQFNFCEELFSRVKKELRKELKNPVHDSYDSYSVLYNRYRMASDLRRIRREILTLTKMLEGAKE